MGLFRAEQHPHKPQAVPVVLTDDGDGLGQPNQDREFLFERAVKAANHRYVMAVVGWSGLLGGMQRSGAESGFRLGQQARVDQLSDRDIATVDEVFGLYVEQDPGWQFVARL